ncbi:MAG TPA: serine hydrolase, partial [Pseudonocardia sp.]|nr:serine hydrolase [Pseudonocardia sp.]
ILQLQEAGTLSIKDALCRWIAPCPDAWSGVTLEQLLHHTSGIPEIWNLIQAGGYSAAHPAMQADAMSLLRNQDQLNFEPGQFFEGNGSNYLLLAEVVQSASGQSLPDFLRDRVFTPVQLDIDSAGEASGDVAVNYAEVLGQLQPALPDGLLVNGPGLQLGTPTVPVR